MSLFWPKDAAGDFSQNIDLNKKDKEDIQNICGLLGKNKIIKSLGVTASVINNQITLTNNKLLKVEIIFHKNLRRIMDKYYWVQCRNYYGSEKNHPYINTNHFVFGSDSSSVFDVPEITLFRNIPKHITTNIVSFVSLVKKPKYLDPFEINEIFEQTGFGEYGG